MRGQTLNITHQPSNTSPNPKTPDEHDPLTIPQTKHEHKPEQDTHQNIKTNQNLTLTHPLCKPKNDPS